MSDTDSPEMPNIKVGVRFSGKSREVTLKIIGMHCATCSLTVQKALLSVPGVLASSVSLASDETRVVIDEDSVNYSELLRAVQRAGYDVYREETTILLSSLSPGDEVAILRALDRVGIFNVRFNFINQSVIIEYNPLDVTVDELTQTLREAGFKVISVRSGEIDWDVDRRAVESDLRDILRRLIVAIPLTTAILIMMLLNTYSLISTPLYNALALTLATPVQFYSGWRFIKGAVRAFKNATANMDTLVALGTLTAYIFSVLVFVGLLPGITFFDSSAAVITFILVGRYIEVRSRLNASSTIRNLAKLQPRTARVIRGSSEVEVTVDELRPGDLVVIRQGELIPVDGIVSEGEGYVDESSMSGEYMPRHKKPGELVLAGTHLVRGYLVVSTTRSGRYALISQVIKLARQAQASRLPIQSLVDKVSSAFTWFVIASGIATLIAWITVGAPMYVAVEHMTSVLVVACPCALGLATPISVVVGINRASQKGIVIKDANAVEKLTRSVRVVAFDKTGTLTLGKPKVTAVIGGNEVLALAATAEVKSEHPLAKAIVNSALEKGLRLGNVVSADFLQGIGVVSQLADGTLVAVGNEKIIEGLELKVPSNLSETASRLRAEGNTVVYVAINGEVRGVLALGDEIRPEAFRVIDFLSRLGLTTVMITGDNYINARLIAGKLGIKEVYAGLLPGDKVKVINELRSRYGGVAMIGDGINDAAALSSADVGIAMGHGSDITKEAGDIVLLGDRLDQLIDLVKLSRKILNNIRTNLVYAFLYNAILIPIAAGVIPGLTLRPEFAGLAMALSSISVTLNALRLRRA